MQQWERLPGAARAQTPSMDVEGLGPAGQNIGGKLAHMHSLSTRALKVSAGGQPTQFHSDSQQDSRCSAV
mgnify:CR=1 FL=1